MTYFLVLCFKALLLMLIVPPVLLVGAVVLSLYLLMCALVLSYQALSAALRVLTRQPAP